MPSHQDRREPLPASYQYGEMSRVRLVRRRLENAIETYLDQWELEHPYGPEATIDDFFLHVKGASRCQS